MYAHCWFVESWASRERVFGDVADIAFGTGPMPFTSVSR